MSHWVASPVDEEAELRGWRQMAARSLSSSEFWRNRVVVYQVLRFWEALGYIGLVTAETDEIADDYQDASQLMFEESERADGEHLLRFWEALGWIGALSDAATSIHFYQEQADIALGIL